MFLIRNKRTKEFIDNNNDWTMIKSFAKRFDSLSTAQRFINNNQTINDDTYMEIIKE